MTSHEDDEIYGNLDAPRSKRTKFRDVDHKDSKSAKRNKPNSKRSHRQKTAKDDYWPDAGD
jgi:hypothetical protein